MRMMAILLGASVFVYFITGFNKKFNRMTRLYFALGTMIVVYLIAMFLVLFGGKP